MIRPPVWAVVPVKPFRFAKARLSPILAAHERCRLARIMLEDVLAVVAESQAFLEGFIVPTADEEAAALARGFGAHVLIESAPAGLNAAVSLAIDYLAGEPDASMLVIPTDLPQLSPGAIERMIALLAAPKSVALVKATGDRGTNLLGCRPATVISPRYGSHSFDEHCQAARAAGIAAGILECGDLGNDLDRPDDLAMFLTSGSSTRTHAYLTSLGIGERLSWSMRS
jgi:2-phospho-L-lactate guanylyltransferase